MKNGFTGLGLMVVGTLLAVGCGGAEPESTRDAPASAESTPPQEPLAGESQEPGADEGEGTVRAENACCYAKCSDQQWHGPFTKVPYGSCKRYAEFWCPNHKLGYVSHKWDGC